MSSLLYWTACFCCASFSPICQCLLLLHGISSVSADEGDSKLNLSTRHPYPDLWLCSDGKSFWERTSPICCYRIGCCTKGKREVFSCKAPLACLSHTSLAPPNTFHRSTCQAATTSDETDSGFSGCKVVGDITECCRAQALNWGKR